MDIAVLKNDNVPVQLRGDFPGYDRMIADWISPLADEIRTTVYEMFNSDKPALHHDLYISSGSSRSVYEEEEWIHRYRDTVRDLHEKKKPHFGICFGHQMTALALGGKVSKADGWGVGVHRWEVTDSEFWPGQGNLSLCASHQDQVKELTPEMKPFLGSEFCPQAGFTVGRHIMTVQGHPEFSLAYMGALMDMRKARYTEEVFLRGKSSLTSSTQEKDLIPLIKNFFFGD